MAHDIPESPPAAFAPAPAIERPGKGSSSSAAATNQREQECQQCCDERSETPVLASHSQQSAQQWAQQEPAASAIVSPPPHCCEQPAGGATEAEQQQQQPAPAPHQEQFNLPREQQQQEQQQHPDLYEEAADDLSLMVYYKVLPCGQSHSWNCCPYRHIGEKARRRSLLLYSYNAQICPDARKKTGCPRGDTCTMTHSMFEFWMHPQKYRTTMCKDGRDCNRPFCFFAHKEEELRPACDRLPEGLKASPDKLRALCLQLAAKTASVTAELGVSQAVSSTGGTRISASSSNASSASIIAACSQVSSVSAPPGSSFLQPAVLSGQVGAAVSQNSIAGAGIAGAFRGDSGAFHSLASPLRMAVSSSSVGTQFAPAGSPAMLQNAFVQLDLQTQQQQQQQHHYAPVAADTAAIIQRPSHHSGESSRAGGFGWSCPAMLMQGCHSVHNLPGPWQPPRMNPWSAGMQQQQQQSSNASYISPSGLMHDQPILLHQPQPQQQLWLSQAASHGMSAMPQLQQLQLSQQLTAPLVVNPQQQQLQLPLMLQPQAHALLPCQEQQQQQQMAVAVPIQQQFMLLAVPATLDMAHAAAGPAGGSPGAPYVQPQAAATFQHPGMVQQVASVTANTIMVQQAPDVAHCSEMTVVYFT